MLPYEPHRSRVMPQLVVWWWIYSGLERVFQEERRRPFPQSMPVCISGMLDEAQMLVWLKRFKTHTTYGLRTVAKERRADEARLEACLGIQPAVSPILSHLSELDRRERLARADEASLTKFEKLLTKRRRYHDAFLHRLRRLERLCRRLSAPHFPHERMTRELEWRMVEQLFTVCEHLDDFLRKQRELVEGLRGFEETIWGHEGILRRMERKKAEEEAERAKEKERREERRTVGVGKRKREEEREAKGYEELFGTDEEVELVPSWEPAMSMADLERTLQGMLDRATQQETVSQEELEAALGWDPATTVAECDATMQLMLEEMREDRLSPGYRR